MVSSNESTVIFLNNIAISLLHHNQNHDSMQTFKDAIRLLKQCHQQQHRHRQGDVCMSSASYLAKNPKNYNKRKNYSPILVNHTNENSNCIQNATRRLAKSTTAFYADGGTCMDDISLMTFEMSPDSLKEMTSVIMQSKERMKNDCVDVDLIIRLPSLYDDDESIRNHDSNFQTAVLLYNYGIAMKRYIVNNNKIESNRSSKHDREAVLRNNNNCMKLFQLSYHFLNDEYNNRNNTTDVDIFKNCWLNLVTVFISILISQQKYEYNNELLFELYNYYVHQFLIMNQSTICHSKPASAA